MRKCRHRSAPWWPHFDEVREIVVRQIRCIGCGETLSMGPSNDTGDAVAVEIRAAEVAVMPIGEDGLAWSEFVGWCAGSDDNPLSMSVTFDGEADAPRQYDAGYLVRCIATHHDEGQP